MAFEQLEAEMTVLRENELTSILGGSGTAQDMVNYMLANNISSYNSSNGYGSSGIGYNHYNGNSYSNSSQNQYSDSSNRNLSNSYNSLDGYSGNRNLGSSWGQDEYKNFQQGEDNICFFCVVDEDGNWGDLYNLSGTRVGNDGIDDHKVYQVNTDSNTHLTENESRAYVNYSSDNAFLKSFGGESHVVYLGLDKDVFKTGDASTDKQILSLHRAIRMQAQEFVIEANSDPKDYDSNYSRIANFCRTKCIVCPRKNYCRR